MAAEKNKKKNICVLFGGVSPEHEVSLRSARMVLDNIDREKYRVFPVGIRKDGKWLLHAGESWELPDGTWEINPGNTPAFISPDRTQGLVYISGKGMRSQKLDCVFPVLHGENGEDGSIQGLLQVAGIPYVGCGVGASSSAMDKSVTKLIVNSVGIKQAEYKLVQSASYNRKSFIENFDFEFPVFVKPCRTGSSVGITKVNDISKLGDAIENALKFDTKVLVEEFIDGREIEVAVLGNENAIASPCGEIVANADFYDYDTKYVSDCAELHAPAALTDEESRQLRESALKVYSALGCSGLSRVDFFLSKSNGVVFNEINTIPGFTSISMYPKLFECSGISNAELVERLIELALCCKK